MKQNILKVSNIVSPAITALILFVAAFHPTCFAQAKNKQPKQIGALLDQPGAIKGQRSWENAWRLETRNFVVRSNISPEATREIGRVMEALLYNFNRMFNADIPQKISVLVPRNRSQFEQIRTVSKGVKGWFSTRSGGQIVTYYQPQKGSRTTDVLLHEGTHMVVMLALTDLRPPDVWVNEGIAVYFEASEFNKTDLVIGKKPKKRLLMVKKLIEEEKYTPIKKLIQKGQKQFNARDYAQAWSLVYYLLHSHDHKFVDRFNKYLISFKKDQSMDPIRRFKLAFRTPIDQLEQDWLRYVRSMDASDEDTVQITGER